MDSEHTRRQVAQPAEEEIKKHGDPFKQQVAEAGRDTRQDEEGAQEGSQEGGESSGEG